MTKNCRGFLMSIRKTDYEKNTFYYELNVSNQFIYQGRKNVRITDYAIQV